MTVGYSLSHNCIFICSDQEFDGPTTSSIPRSDEQSALSRILHQTATNVVDVSAMSPHSVEQQEYMDRTRQYRYGVF
jgi:hypothetical protein